MNRNCTSWTVFIIGIMFRGHWRWRDTLLNDDWLRYLKIRI